jgi:hypothetical protein
LSSDFGLAGLWSLPDNPEELKEKVISCYFRKNTNFYRKVRNGLDGSLPHLTNLCKFEVPIFVAREREKLLLQLPLISAILQSDIYNRYPNDDEEK